MLILPIFASMDKMGLNSTVFNYMNVFFRNNVSPDKDIDQSGDEVSSDDQMDLEDQSEAHSIRHSVLC